jgi:hypothetical protein
VSADLMRSSIISTFSRCAADNLYYQDATPAAWDNANTSSSTGSVPDLPIQCYAITRTFTGNLTALEVLHQRCAHHNYKDLKAMTNCKGKPTCLCPICATSNATKCDRPKGKREVPRCPLQVVSWDLCGKSKAKTPEGFDHAALFVDAHTKWKFPALQRTKDNSLDSLKRMRAHGEALSNHTLSTLNSDDENVLTKGSVRKYCLNESIHIASAPPYQHEQVPAERAMRTIKQKARAMMLHGGAPPKFWGHAFTQACYVSNRIATRTTEGKTPNKVMMGKPDPYGLTTLRTLYCAAYATLPAKQGMSEPNATKCVNLGHCWHNCSFRLLNLDTRRVFFSADVRFDETVFP